MSFARACQQCRAAKAKCDLSLPTCGRCATHGLNCSGIAPDVGSGFLFRDENQTARRNSERARRETRPARIIAVDYSIATPSKLPAQVFVTKHNRSFRGSYPWLNDVALTQVPEPLRRDFQTRAVERFFVNWTLNPDNDGVSPGHMSELPSLYHSSPPESFLWHAVRATAFADMHQRGTTGNSFSSMALQHYGISLHRLRTIARYEQGLSSDHVLAGLLLIDNFESIYLARTEPLGAHSAAVMHVLHARGNDQFYNQSQFSLWRVAHHRLQARQLLLREEPDIEQVIWLNKLNTQIIPLHISVDVQQMNMLAARAKKITVGNQVSLTRLAVKIAQARSLIRSMLDLLQSIQAWTTAVNDIWKPRTIDPRNIAPAGQEVVTDLPLPPFHCPGVLDYHDIWLSYMWNFHSAAQMILRESLIEVQHYILALEGREPAADESQIIVEQEEKVHLLSSMIIRSFPQLLGFIHRETRGPNTLPNGMMVGRFFSLFSMAVIKQARLTSAEHKQTALEVMEWVTSSHGLNKTDGAS